MKKESDVKDIEELVLKFFNIMDRVESNDEGTRYFRPTYISSCRSIDLHNLTTILGDLREAVGLSRNPPPLPISIYDENDEDEVG
jgi:hypothetical protein